MAPALQLYTATKHVYVGVGDSLYSSCCVIQGHDSCGALFTIVECIYCIRTFQTKALTAYFQLGWINVRWQQTLGFPVVHYVKLPLEHVQLHYTFLCVAGLLVRVLG